jgi:hypothetical protein
MHHKRWVTNPTIRARAVLQLVIPLPADLLGSQSLIKVVLTIFSVMILAVVSMTTLTPVAFGVELL